MNAAGRGPGRLSGGAWLLTALAVGCGAEVEEPFGVPYAVADSPRSAGVRREAKSPAGEPIPASAAASAMPEGLVSSDSEYLFDPDEVRTYELELAPADLAFLDGNPTAEQYVQGALLFEGQRIEPVGIRYKGSYGGFQGCVAGTGVFPSGPKTCPKLGMKIKIDWADPKAEFYGQRKLLFHAMNRDPSLMREHLGYGLFAEMGIPASRTAYIRVVVNGQFVGLFSLVEEVDGRFTRRHFSEGGKGNLYKEAWPLVTDEQRYLDALETNRTENPRAEKVLAMARAVEAATPAAMTSVLERYLDFDYVATYIAVDRAIANDDGIFHWYCTPIPVGLTWMQQRSYAGYSCGNHNYYWYEEAEGERLWIIPWDLDVIARSTEPISITLAKAWNDLEAPCDAVLNTGQTTGQMPAACDALTRAWAELLTPEVRALTRRFVDGPFSEASVQERVDRWADQITPVVAEASRAHPDELTPAEWQAGVAQLMTVVRTVRAAVAAE